MGLGSGLEIIKKIYFSSPVTGGLRGCSLGYSWSAGGQMTDDEKIQVYHLDCYDDELTPEIIEWIRNKAEELAMETGREVAETLFESRPENLKKLQKEIDNARPPYQDLAHFTSIHMGDRLRLQQWQLFFVLRSLPALQGDKNNTMPSNYDYMERHSNEEDGKFTWSLHGDSL